MSKKYSGREERRKQLQQPEQHVQRPSGGKQRGEYRAWKKPRVEGVGGTWIKGKLAERARLDCTRNSTGHCKEFCLYPKSNRKLLEDFKHAGNVYEFTF